MAFDGGIPPDAENLLSEVSARRILNQRFRNAGYRILNDSLWKEEDIEVTLDGYDPEKEVGFEYIAPSEVGVDITDAETHRLRGHRAILVVEPMSKQRLERYIEEFLSKIDS